MTQQTKQWIHLGIFNEETESLTAQGKSLEWVGWKWNSGNDDMNEWKWSNVKQMPVNRKESIRGTLVDGTPKANIIELYGRQQGELQMRSCEWKE